MSERVFVCVCFSNTRTFKACITVDSHGSQKKLDFT